MREKLSTYDAGTRDIIIYRDTDPKVYGWLEIKLHPEKYPSLKPQPFTMPCRPVCGLDLKRVRFTCIFTCKTRRIHTGKMPAMNELADIYTLMIMKRRRLERLKAFVLKKLLPICEWAASY
jgi:hypothetical protein